MTTALDTAFFVMEDAPEDEGMRRAYYARLMATELFVPLDDGTPQTIEMDGTEYVLCFDSEARLADFAEGATERAVLSGRALVGASAEAKAGLGVNLGVAESAWLLPPETVAWMASAQEGPSQETSVIGAIYPPNMLEASILGVDEIVAGLSGQASTAVLVRSDTEHVIVISGTIKEAEPAVAAHIAEARAIRMPNTPLSVMFSDEPAVLELANGVGVAFDIPKPVEIARIVPGSDPSKPPKLR